MERLRVMIGSDEFKDKYRQGGKDSTRRRVLTFVGLVVSQLNLMSKSLSVGVSRFVERFSTVACDYTKQAFSQRRRKLKAEAFTALNPELVGQYHAAGGYKTWRGHLLLAVDGSTLQLPGSSWRPSARRTPRGRACPWGAAACSMTWGTGWCSTAFWGSAGQASGTWPPSAWTASRGWACRPPACCSSTGATPACGCWPACSAGGWAL